MLKKLSILLLSLIMVVPAMAQPEESCECMFAPKAGQWQIDLVLGQGQAFNDGAAIFQLLPVTNGAVQGPLGVQTGTNHYTEDIATFINIGSLNNNNLVNIAGIKGTYFITNRWDINFMAAYNVNLQPSKDFIEGEKYFNLDDAENMVGELGVMSDPFTSVGDEPAQKAIVASVSHSLMSQIGANYHFKIKNSRIDPYVGVVGQYKLARIEANFPYTGEYVFDKDLQSTQDIAQYRVNYRAGQLMGFAGGVACGINYSISEGLILGIEVNPVLYQYTLLHMQLQGSMPYYASNHNVSVFKYPQLKIGFRF